jgi:hypothetical protein
MITVQKLLSLLQCNQPATAEEIEQLEEALEARLPADYIQFMRAANGGVGMVGGSYIVFFGISDLIKAHEIDLDFGGSGRYVAFATDGANAKYAFDSESSPPNKVVKLDKIDEDLLFACGDSFLAFLDHAFKQRPEEANIRYTKAEAADFLKRSQQFLRERKKKEK